MYILTYNIQIKKSSLTASTTLVEKKYRSSWFTVQVLMMSHSITFHSVSFEISTVPKRETIEGSRSLQSSSVFPWCLIWFPRKKSPKIAKNRLRFFPKWKNRFKGGPEPSNFEDFGLVNVSVKYFSKLCFGTIKIQPELKYLKTILEDFTSWFQRAKAWEHEFGRVPSISFIFTGSKMARICKVIYYQYFTCTMSN